MRIAGAQIRHSDNGRFSASVHSPSGKLVQIEYALSAVAAGSPSVGIKGKLMQQVWVVEGVLYCLDTWHSVTLGRNDVLVLTGLTKFLIVY